MLRFGCDVSWIVASEGSAGALTKLVYDCLGLYSTVSVMREEGNKDSRGGGNELKLQKKVSSDLYVDDRWGNDGHQ